MVVVVAFDLKDAGREEYDTAYRVLAQLGLEPVSLNKELDLPQTTVMGDVITDAADAAGVRDIVWKALKRAGLVPTRLFGGIVESWAARTVPDEE